MNKIIFKGFASLLVIAGLASCSSDYLQVEPETTIPTDQVGKTVGGARLGMYGACRAMYAQYPGWDDYLSVNGEPYMNTMYGEIMGSDFFSQLYSVVFGQDNYNWVGMNMQNGWMTSMIWRYYYGLIFKCNVVLDSFPEEIPESDAKDYNFIKAQLLTIRSHAYTKLLQYYAPRWEESGNGAGNGETYCIVWRENSTIQDTPLVTMKTVKENVYRDLDEALKLYEETGGSRSNIWEPDERICMGIYSRLALLVHDYDTAQKMAHDAREGISLMTNEEYLGGFAEPVESWLWANDGDFNGIYYWAWGSWWACNGAYPTLWPYGGPVINYDLYRKMNTRDIRRDLYWTPDKGGRRIPESMFWDPLCVDASSMNMNSQTGEVTYARLQVFCTERIPEGGEEKWGVPYHTQKSDKTWSSSDIMIFFGSHFKFWSTDSYGSDAIPFMRAEEMLFNEAEAAYFNHDEPTAQKCLEEINKMRIGSTYKCMATGDALLDEIQTNKRIEMWGEGFCWPDLKRWGLDMERTAWVENDPTSGNIPAAFAITKTPEEHYGWRYNVPKVESDYNHAINRSLLDF